MKRLVEIVEKLARDLRHIPQVLIVEDNPDDLFLMSRTLEEFGCQVLSAESADRAIQLIDERQVENLFYPFDVVFLDLKLIGSKNGTVVLRHLNRTAPKVPVVIVTGHPQGDLIEDAANIGYFGLVKKPLEEESVQRIFQLHRIRYYTKAVAAA